MLNRKGAVSSHAFKLSILILVITAQSALLSAYDIGNSSSQAHGLNIAPSRVLYLRGNFAKGIVSDKKLERANGSGSNTGNTITVKDNGCSRLQNGKDFSNLDDSASDHNISPRSHGEGRRNVSTGKISNPAGMLAISDRAIAISLEDVHAIDILEATTFGSRSQRTTAASGEQKEGRRRSLSFRCDMTVAQDGSGAFWTIQSAIDSITGTENAPRTRRVVVCIRPGVYNEQVVIPPGKDFVSLVGSGRKTIIAAGNSKSKSSGPYNPATLLVKANYFAGKSLVIKNTYMSTWDPAPAVAIIGNMSVWKTVGMTGWMDTLGMYTGLHYFYNVLVSGLADVVWAFGKGFFRDCTIYYVNVPGYIGYLTASGTDTSYGAPGQPSGLVFSHCQLFGQGPCYLGRPYRDQVSVTFVQCNMGANIMPAGYADWNYRCEMGSVKYLEINSYGRGARPNDRQCSRSVHMDKIPFQYTLEGFLQFNQWWK
eukprot:TRINITY_DN4026_c0_g1_i3.p1 TRINITY_DN4026_c0_g1~~TRINITY_DN4026_c0_g1_i3.p1  ORF type:complete len:482 (+),score=37.92 TRINITY_DN4026_c0_g1_i3:192-1637(+)